MEIEKDQEKLKIPESIEVPYASLSAESLEGVIDDFILREGTDYGCVEASLEQKRADVLRLLERREARIFYDPDSESITLVSSQLRPQ